MSNKLEWRETLLYVYSFPKKDSLQLRKIPLYLRASLVAQMVKHLPAIQETQV